MRITDKTRKIVAIVIAVVLVGAVVFSVIASTLTY